MYTHAHAHTCFCFVVFVLSQNKALVSTTESYYVPTTVCNSVIATCLCVQLLFILLIIGTAQEKGGGRWGLNTSHSRASICTAIIDV